MVLVPVLCNNINPNTFNTYISSLPRNPPSSTHIRATMFSPGGNTHRTVSLHSYSLVQGKHSPTAHITNLTSAHQQRIYTATQCGCLRASGASQMGNPLHDEYVFPVLAVPTASRSLLGRVSPYWWEVTTHYPDSSSRCVRPAQIGSQLGQYPFRPLAPIHVRRIHNIYFGITLFTHFTVITFHITELPDDWAVSSDEYTTTLYYIRNMSALHQYTSD